MRLKNFKPNIPVTIERWSGTHHVFELGARECVDIEAAPEGLLVTFEAPANEGQPARRNVYLVTGPGYGELAPLDEEFDVRDSARRGLGENREVFEELAKQ